MRIFKYQCDCCAKEVQGEIYLNEITIDIPVDGHAFEEKRVEVCNECWVSLMVCRNIIFNTIKRRNDRAVVNTAPITIVEMKKKFNKLTTNI